MTENDYLPHPEAEFAKRVASWVVVLLAVYLTYSASHFLGRADAAADFLAMLARRLPVMIAQILPPAVFAGALGGCGILGGRAAGSDVSSPAGSRPGSPRRHWVFLAVLTVATYALPAVVVPMFATWTGSDWPSLASLLESAGSARAAAEAASGYEAGGHLRDAANALATLLVPMANAAFVPLAAVLGDLTGRLTCGLSIWPRYATRWLSGGLLFATFWIPAAVAAELVEYEAAWGGLLFVLPLSVPLAAAGILLARVRPDHGSAR